MRGIQPKSISVILPAHNEAANIGQTLRTVLDVFDASEFRVDLVVVSDGSSDDTAARATAIDASRVQVLEFRENRGKGAAIAAGHKIAHGELVAFLDADGDIDPTSLLRMASLLVTLDVDGCVGSKVHPDSEVSYPAFRRMQSASFRALIRNMFHMSVGDTQTGAKVFKREVLDDTLPFVTSNGFEFDLELLALAHKMGFVIVEGPVHLNFQFSSTVKWHDALTLLVAAFRVRTRVSAAQVLRRSSTIGTIDTPPST